VSKKVGKEVRGAQGSRGGPVSRERHRYHTHAGRRAHRASSTVLGRLSGGCQLGQPAQEPNHEPHSWSDVEMSLWLHMWPPPPPSLQAFESTHRSTLTSLSANDTSLTALDLRCEHLRRSA